MSPDPYGKRWEFFININAVLPQLISFGSVLLLKGMRF